MVSVWRRALCTSIPDDPDSQQTQAQAQAQAQSRLSPLSLIFRLPSSPSKVPVSQTPSLPKTPPSSHLSHSHSHGHRLYDDDEPLTSPDSSILFQPIPESDDESQPQSFVSDNSRLAISISPETAVVSVSRTSETCAVLLTVKSPPASRHASVDLVTVVDVGTGMTPTKLHTLKRSMRILTSSLSSNDRLSIVAFSSTSKRLLPLRRMTPTGRRSARRIIDALNIGHGCCVNDALRKATKVIHDRKEKNQFATIILLDGKHDTKKEKLVSSTRFSNLEIPVHTFKIREELNEEVFVKSLTRFLSVVVFDLRLKLSISSGSAPVEIEAVYSCTDRPGSLNADEAKLGDLYSEEERQILVEMKVPHESNSNSNSNHIISIRSFSKDPTSDHLIDGGEQNVVVPFNTVRSSDPSIQRLRAMFVMTKAVAESRRLLSSENNDIDGAGKLLVSARAVLTQMSLKFPVEDDFRRRLEAELAEVIWRRQEEKRRREKEDGGGGGGRVVEDEVVTPISAWKAAERLAKVAIMKKSLNRVGDLHGFEDARF